MARLRRGVARQRWSRAQFVAQSLVLVAVLGAGLLLPVPFAGSGASAADKNPVSFEVGYLRSAFSSTYAQRDGSMKTVLSLAPVHYRDAKGGWRDIKSNLVASDREGYAWRNEEAGFKADLKGDAGAEDLVRFETGGARFTLTPEDAGSKPVERKPSEEALAYRGVYDGVDLEYQLLSTGVKETLVLAAAAAPAVYRFRLAPVEGSEFVLEERDDGGLDVRTPGSALPVAVISAPTVSDSRKILVEDRVDRKMTHEAIIDNLPAPGKASMSAKREPDGSYLLTLSIEEKWLSDPERLFPVKLDPTVTTAVDLQDGYWYMDCAGGTCTPDTTSNALVVSKNGTGTSQHTGGNFNNGTLRNTSGMVFSLGDIPSGATITSTQLQLYQTGCYVVNGPTSCPFWWPEWGEGYSGTIAVKEFDSAWGSATTAATADAAINSTVLASRSFSMVASQGGADAPDSWKSWSGSGLTSWVQDVASGVAPNHGLALTLTPTYYGWGAIFASAEYSDPSKAPMLEVQWVADGVQLNPSTNIHSDGPELTWTRFAAGYGAYTNTVLADQPRVYWRMNDASGSPFGVADWSGNSLHATPTSLQFGEAGKTADGDTSIYFNGSSSLALAGEGQITDTFTLEAWVKPAVAGTRRTVFSRGESNGGGFRLLINAANQLELAYGDFGGTVATSTATVPASAWHHVAATKSGSSVHLYIDGQDVTGSVSNYTMTNGVGVIAIGAMRYYDYVYEQIGYDDFFNGWIDEPAVYATALSQTRIGAHVTAASTAGAGFKDFEVHRSQTAGFTPSTSTLIQTIKDPAIQYYRDTTAKASSTFYYKVVTVATDGSDTSNQLTVATPAAGNATITVQPGVSLMGADATTIASGGGDCANNGASGGITASATQAGLLRFDLRQIPTGSNVTNADLSLWTFQNGGGQTIGLYRVTGDWTEGSGSGSCDSSGASWKDRQPNVPWSSAGADYDSTAVRTFTSSGADPHWEGGATNGDITQLVEDWVGTGKTNLGLLIKNTTASSPVTWTSDDYSGSVALRPKLDVTYEDGSDPKEPTVTMGAPGNGAKVTGNVTVTAAAGDDSKVAQVEFLRGGVVYATDTTAPWQATLDTSGLTAGSSHDLTARATDDVGQVTTSTPITVTKRSAAPTTSVTVATGTSTLTVSASASDDIGVSKVEFYVDDERFASDASSPFQGTLNTLTFPVYDGAHTLTSRAYDADGSVTISSDYPVTVANTTGTKYQASIASSQTQNPTTVIPVGTVVAYAGTMGSIPSGWALADGAALSRTTYSDLFTAVGTAYGAGDGSTTFNLPDLRGRLPLGRASSGTGSTLGGTGGSLSMGGSPISLPAVAPSFDTPPVTFSAGAVSAFTPTGFSFPTGAHYNYWTSDSALGSVSVGSGGGLSAGWTTFVMPSQTVTGSSVTPTASLSTATAAYRVVNYIVKTTTAGAFPTCAVWPSARTSTPSGATAADGSTASGALATCLATEYSGSTPDLRGRFPLGKAASGTGSTLNDSGGARDFTHTITRSVPATTVSVANYSTSLTVTGGSYPASYTWHPFGGGNGTDVYLYRCLGGAGSGTCLPANATTPSVSTGSTSGGGAGPYTSTTAGGVATTAAYNPAYQAVDFYAGANSAAPGTLTAFAGASTPAGWLVADGSCVSQTTYATLYAAIGSAYGSSCAEGEFTLPNLRGRFPLAKAASGTGSTLGETGGSLDVTPSAALGTFTVSFDWTPSNFSFSVPARTATLNLGSNYDHQYAGSDYSSVLWNGGSFTSGSFGSTTFSATPSPTGARTVTSTAAGATTPTFATENPPFQTVNYLIATGPSAGPESVIPKEARYDATASTQEQNRSTVYLTNNSAVTWSSSSVYLRYQWIAPDGTVTSSTNVSLGANILAGASASITVDYDPPTLPTGVLRALYTLRFDLVDTSSGTVYFAGQGNKPLEAKVLVTRVTPLELGLERYQQYEPLDLGGGLTASVNLADGNLVVSGSLVQNPGRGLSTLVDLAYNSQEPASFAPAGNGISLGSGLARLGQPLDIHPNASDTALSRTTKWIGFADGDGTYHRFVGRAIAGDTYYDEPAGVHLYLRATGSSDPNKYWALTRPDRVTFYYNEAGWPTLVEDADGNALTYTLATVASNGDAYGAGKRVTKITDAAAREVTLAYYSKTETPRLAVRGKLKTITDHAGRVTRLEYYDDGNLMRVVQAGGIGDDNGFVGERSLVFTYRNAAGTAPAIATLGARQNPDPTTSQGRLLYSLIDYRGNETSFAYATTGSYAGQLASWTDRAGKTTNFTYSILTAAVTPTFMTGWEHGVTPSTSGAGLANSIENAGGISLSSTVKRSGGWSMKHQIVSSATRTLWGKAMGSGGVGVARVAINATTLPSSGKVSLVQLTSSSGTSYGVVNVSSAGVLSARLGAGTEVNGPTIAAGQWYVLDAKFDSSGTTWTFDWKVDDITQTQATEGSHSAATGARNIHLTTDDTVDASNTITVYFDDLMTSVTSANYPLPDFQTLGATLDQATAAQHQTITTSQVQYTDNFSTFTNLTGNTETDSRSRLDDLNTSDGIRMNTTAALAGNLRWPIAAPANPYGVAPLGVSALIPVREASTGTNNATIRMYLSASTANVFNADPGWGTTWNYLGLMMASKPGGGAWASADIANLKLEADSTDASPNVWLSGLQLEIAYPIASSTTVARPLSRTSQYAFDASGRVRAITNPLGLKTNVIWTADNNVSSVVNAATARATSYSYNANGYLLSSTNEAGNKTVLTYEDNTVDADDVTGNWPAGRSIPHLSQLDTYAKPVGVATTGIANDYKWSFDYTTSGNLQTSTDPLGNVTTNTYNGDGTLATTTLPANGDSLTRTTTYESYDGNGLPTAVLDAAGGHAKAAYGADGRPLWVQDPIHNADSGGDTRSYRQVFDYDGYGRIVRSSTPKSSNWARGLLVWSETGYDTNGNVVKQLSPYYSIDGGGYGRATTSAYDAMDRPTSVIAPDSSLSGTRETQTVYDDAGRTIKLITPKGVLTAATDDYTTVTGYDLLDRPASESRYELNGTGAGATVTSSRTTVYCYDAAGDLRSVTGPKGSSGLTCPSATTWPYVPLSSPTYTTKVTYDTAHRQTRISDPLGHNTDTAYDENGQVVSVTDDAGKVTTTDYTYRGEPNKLVQPFDTGRNITSLTEYDNLGNVKRSISPRGYDVGGSSGPWNEYVTSYSYDKLSRLTRTSLPKATSEAQAYTHNAYDDNGRLLWTSLPTTVTDPSSVAAADKTVSDYWDTGQIYSTTVGGSPKVRYDYTAEGWQAWRLPETAQGTGVADYGRMMFWEYFPDGRLGAERDLAGRRSSSTYDANGNRTGASEAQSIAGDILTVASSFDGFDELKKVVTPRPAGDFWASEFAYDGHSNVTSLVENRVETAGGSQQAAGRTFTYTYDQADQPTYQTDDSQTPGSSSDDERYAFTFDNLGRLSTRVVAKDNSGSWATEQTQTSGYYFNGQLKQLETTDGASATIAKHQLEYITGGAYQNGNKTKDTFRVANPDTGAPCRTADCVASWLYDGRDRLKQDVNGTGTTSDYTLDTIGNVTEEKRNSTTFRTATYSGQRLSTSTASGTTVKYLYDSQGNVDCVVLSSWASSSCPAVATGVTPANELVSDNVYDYRDRLIAIRAYNSGAAGDKTEYRYDPLSRPTKKTATEAGTTTTTDMVYLGVSDAVVRETETGAATKDRTYAFDVLGDRATISEKITGTTSRWSYVYDPLGSAEILLDQANSVKATYGYTAYGDANPSLTKTAAGFTPTTNLYRYTGKRWDPAAKAYDMGARTYYPGIGRWFQQDQYAGALDNLALSTDPLTQNRYAFTGANPINYVELDGHSICGIATKLCDVTKKNLTAAAKKAAKVVKETAKDVAGPVGGTITKASVVFLAGKKLVKVQGKLTMTGVYYTARINPVTGVVIGSMSGTLIGDAFKPMPFTVRIGRAATSTVVSLGAAGVGVLGTAVCEYVTGAPTLLSSTPVCAAGGAAVGFVANTAGQRYLTPVLNQWFGLNVKTNH